MTYAQIECGLAWTIVATFYCAAAFWLHRRIARAA
jgi:predicted Co/Zn/Cd cation transporter (cation efflux family)